MLFEPRDDLAALPEFAQCTRHVALFRENPRNVVVSDSHIALPASIVRVGVSQVVANGEAVPVGLQRLVEIAPRLKHVANIVV